MNDKIDTARRIRNRHLLAGVSFVVLAIGVPWSASAADYTASNETELRDAINDANADPDPSATITLLNSFAVTNTAFPLPIKPMRIDTQSFILSGIASAPTNQGNIVFTGNFPSVSLTVAGALVGGNSTVGINAGAGLSVSSSVGSTGQVINNGSITGGNAVNTGQSGGLGVGVVNSATLVNNGTISGGTGNAFVRATGNSSGSGVGLNGGTSLFNNSGGTIQGGDSQGIGASAGVYISTVAGAVTATNYGTIVGGSDLTGVTVGNSAIRGRGPQLSSITNFGLLEGGNGAAAIAHDGAWNVALVNSGTIRAGAGQSVAIQFGVTSTSRATLELQAGSVIEGNVVGSALGANDTLRLGGSDDAFFDISTIGPQYQNFDIYQKTGSSDWYLTGTGTATTNWDIQSGFLTVGNGATSGSVLGDFNLSGGTLGLYRSDTVTFDNVITGNGGVMQYGSGTTILNGDYTYTGLTSVVAGTLAINGSITTPVTVGSAGTLGGIGTIFGDVTNTGTIAPGNSIGTLTVNGNYIGNGGTIEIETELGDDTSPSDRLVVTGDTSGGSNVKVINTGGTGAATVEGIKIIDVGGVSDGTFSLLGDYVINGEQAVVAGAYGYTLHKNGVATPSDGDWYLRSQLTNPPTTPPTPPTPPTNPPTTPPSPPTNPPTIPPTTPPTTPPAGGPIYQPGAPLYEGYAQNLQVLNNLGSMQQRIGNRYWAGAGSAMIAEGDGPGTPEAAPLPSEGGRANLDSGAIWARIDGAHSSINPDTSTTRSDYDHNSWRLQSGLDGKLYETGSGMLMGGVTVHYGQVSTDASSIFGDGSIDTDGYGIGGTLTWLAQNGFYVDGQAQVTWYESDIGSDTLRRSLANGNDGFGYALSLESGKRIAVDGNWSVTPQAQLAYSNVDFDSFTDPFGARVSLDKSESLKGRLGIAAEYQNAWQDASGRMARSNVYGLANLYHEFLDGSEVDLAGVNFANEGDRTWGGVGVGGSYSWADDKYSIYGEVSLNTSLSHFADSYSVNGTTGFKVKF